jgi:hypothetical protein
VRKRGCVLSSPGLPSQSATEVSPGEEAAQPQTRPAQRLRRNDKASRKNIPRAKARVNRTNRHQDRQILDAALGSTDDAAEDQVEQRLLGARRKIWRKSPDEPLGDVQARTNRATKWRAQSGASDAGQPYTALFGVARNAA